jgi:hypothetical protein
MTQNHPRRAKRASCDPESLATLQAAGRAASHDVGRRGSREFEIGVIGNNNASARIVFQRRIAWSAPRVVSLALRGHK